MMHQLVFVHFTIVSISRFIDRSYYQHFAQNAVYHFIFVCSKLMETGVHGQVGQFAVLVAILDIKQDPASVIIQYHRQKVYTVMETRSKYLTATSEGVQVSLSLVCIRLFLSRIKLSWTFAVNILKKQQKSQYIYKNKERVFTFFCLVF